MNYERPADVAPGFRVNGEILTNPQAFEAMQRAANEVTSVALAARRDLLSLGFADDHSLCRELDRTAAHYTEVFMALRGQQVAETEAFT